MLPRGQVVGLDDRQHPDRPGHRGHADPDGRRRTRRSRTAASGCGRTSSTTCGDGDTAKPASPADRLAGWVARELMAMLQNVVAEGTGTLAARARLPGRRQDRHRGEARRRRAATRTRSYVASFVGIVPATRAAARDPRLGGRAARRDLRRHRRGAGVPADRPVRPPVPRGVPPDAPADDDLDARVTARPVVRFARPPPRGERIEARRTCLCRSHKSAANDAVLVTVPSGLG